MKMACYLLTLWVLGLLSVVPFKEAECLPIFSFPEFPSFHSFFPDLEPETYRDDNFADMERLIIEESANGDISRGDLKGFKGAHKDKIAVRLNYQIINVVI